MSVLDPFSHALATVLATSHSGLASLGLDPGSGTTWVLCIAAVVVIVRVSLLPLVVHGVRQAHASAGARPQLAELTRRYRNRKDPEAMRAFMKERRRIAAEHNVSRFSFLPVIAQVPIWLALYHLVSNVAAGISVGAMTPHLVTSLGAATLLGLPLAQRGYLGAGWTHLAVVAGLSVVAATLAYVTQKFLITPNTVLNDVPEGIARPDYVTTGSPVLRTESAVKSPDVIERMRAACLIARTSTGAASTGAASTGTPARPVPAPCRTTATTCTPTWATAATPACTPTWTWSTTRSATSSSRAITSSSTTGPPSA